MSLATRCPACGTIFRVVQDQLKVSEGWVRCGQCHEVFHGIEHLFDLESDPTFAARRTAARGGTPVADTGEDSVPGFAPTRTPPLGSSRRAGVTPSSPSSPSSPPSPSASRPAPMPAPAPTPVAPPPVARAPSSSPASAPVPLSPAPTTAPGPLRRFMPPPVADAGPASAPVPLAPPPPPGPFERTEVLPPLEPSHGPEAPESLPAIVEPPASSPVPVDFELSAPAALTEPPPATPATAEPAPVPAPPPAADAEATTLPSRLADDAGPETLASLLPEPPGEWPPRKKSSRRPKDKDKDQERRRAATARDREADAERERERAAAREAETALPEPPTEDHPRFVREARSAAFWNSPTMRAGLGLALILLGLGAVGQVAWPMRDTLAVHYPSTAPVFQTLCEQLGCTLQAPRALASLTLEGSSLTRTETDHVLLFTADLRNRSPWPTRTPAFDLRFTDLGGQVVARRVFEPADLGLTQAALGPDAELHVRARLRLEGIDVVGFQAEVFYP